MKNLDIKEILNLGIVLGIISMIAAILLGTTYSVTKPIIEIQKKKAILEAQQNIFPDANSFIAYLNPETKKEIKNEKLGLTILQSFTEAKSSNGETLGYIANVSTPGYGGNIIFVIGFTKEQKIKKIQITEQTETPGLGANATKGSFLDQFMDKRVTDGFEVKKDVTAITAATISSRALTNGIKTLIKYLFEPGKGIYHE
jgi:Na+-translocating ferredoxin:NAD+ oxidoreductase subunit G